MSKPKLVWQIDGREPAPTFGNPDTAEIEVHVGKDPDNTYVRCLCPACFELDNVGVQEAMGDLMDTPGVYYMRAWHTVYPSGPWGPEEYDGGLELAPEPLEEGGDR